MLQRAVMNHDFCCNGKGCWMIVRVRQHKREIILNLFMTHKSYCPHLALQTLWRSGAAAAWFDCSNWVQKRLAVDMWRELSEERSHVDVGVAHNNAWECFHGNFDFLNQREAISIDNWSFCWMWGMICNGRFIRSTNKSEGWIQSIYIICELVFTSNTY